VRGLHRTAEAVTTNSIIGLRSGPAESARLAVLRQMRVLPKRFVASYESVTMATCDVGHGGIDSLLR
jgi:hypothetical protein